MHRLIAETSSQGYAFLSVQPLALIGVVTALAWYLPTAARHQWPWRRRIGFVAGSALVVALTCGPLQAPGRWLFWVYTIQILTLLLILPIILLTGRPLELAARAGRPGTLRLLNSKAMRACRNPIVGAGLIPIGCVVLLFGPVPGWSARWAAGYWIVEVVAFALGLVIAIPLVSQDEETTSLTVGLGVAVGFFELLIDAVPGLAMRLQTHQVSTFFTYRTAHAGLPTWLSDQQRAGAILWCTAELLDLPFLLLLFRRWIQADARDAQFIDAALERASDDLARSHPGEPIEPSVAEQPWFLTDPQLRDRFR